MRNLNEISRAHRISIGSTPTLIKATIGGKDRNDFYRFRLFNRSRLIVNLNGLQATTDTALYDHLGLPVRQMRSRGQLNRAIATDLAAGTYYLRIIGGSRRLDYQLQFSATSTEVNPPFNAP